MMLDTKTGHTKVNTACKNLHRGWPRCSRLQEVDWKRETVPPSSIEMRQNNMVFGAQFQTLRDPQNIPNVNNFKEMVQILKKSFPSATPIFMKAAVVVRLGPEDLLKYHDCMDFGKNRRHILLTYNALQSYVLIVEPRGDAQPAIDQINIAFGKVWKTEDSQDVVISVPNSDFAMRLKTGKDPEIIRTAAETTSLLVFEQEVVSDKPEDYYSDFLNCHVKSAKLLSSAEVLWIEKKLKRAFDNRNIRRLEFSCVRDRNRAAENRELTTLDFLLCDTMFDPNEIDEQVFLEVDYDVRTRLNTTKGIKVTLVNEQDMDWARKVLCKNGLQFEEEKFAQDKKKMLRVTMFQHDMWALMDRLWLLKNIFCYNNIRIESMTPMNNFGESSGNDYGRVIREGLRNLARVPCQQQEHDEAREDRWIFMKTPGSLKYRVYFRDSEIGLKILDKMFSCQKGRDALWDGKNVDPELTPIIRKTFRIARRIRAVFDKIINELDSKFRREFAELSDSESKIMKHPDAYHFFTRIYEGFEDGGDVGTIGVEGWKPEFVQQSLETLRKALEPTTIDASRYPELFYGIGEAFVKELEVKYRDEVVVDIDKYQGVIRIYGSQAAKAYDDCQTYESMKKTTTVRVNIPTCSPSFNCGDMLTETWIREFQTALGARIEMSNDKRYMRFDGTMEAYDILKDGLDEVSSSFFKYQTQNRREELTVTCVSCTKTAKTYFVPSCGHSFCRECANDQVANRLENGEVNMKCLAENCSGFWTPTEILSLICGGSQRLPELDGMKLQKLAISARSAMLRNLADAKECTSTGCLGIWHQTFYPGPKACGMCSTMYCGGCMRLDHEGKWCDGTEFTDETGGACGAGGAGVADGAHGTHETDEADEKDLRRRSSDEFEILNVSDKNSGSPRSSDDLDDEEEW